MISVQKLAPGEDLSEVFTIRRVVFMDEQHVPEADEFDQFEEESVHYLALYENIPCGAARWRSTDNGIKLERFAVLPEFRGKGVGYALVDKVISDVIRENRSGHDRMYLNAQVDVVGLYRKFGFKPVGEVFDECDILHQQMERMI